MFATVVVFCRERREGIYGYLGPQMMSFLINILHSYTHFFFSVLWSGIIAYYMINCVYKDWATLMWLKLICVLGLSYASHNVGFTPPTSLTRAGMSYFNSPGLHVQHMGSSHGITVSTLKRYGHLHYASAIHIFLLLFGNWGIPSKSAVLLYLKCSILHLVTRQLLWEENKSCNCWPVTGNTKAPIIHGL